MVAQLPGEPVVIKNSYSGFINTQLNAYLRAAGIQSIVTIGCASNVCVGETGKTGYFLGYYSMLIPDATSSFTQAEHEAYLRDHKFYYGHTPTTDEIIKVWQEAAK